jgi:hypothetical protein
LFSEPVRQNSGLGRCTMVPSAREILLAPNQFGGKSVGLIPPKVGLKLLGLPSGSRKC